MSILVDTNVILDVLLERELYADNSALIMALVERKQSIGYLCATR